MRFVSVAGILILVMLFLLSVSGEAQDSLYAPNKLWKDFYQQLDSDFIFNNNSFHFPSDSALEKKLKDIFSIPDSSYLTAFLPAIPTIAPISSKTFLKTGSGYVSYNWMYRAGNDSSFVDNNVSQQVISGSFNATISNVLPVRVTYFERRSNSPFFKNFRDVTVDVDVQRYRQLRTQKALNKLDRYYKKFEDPQLPNAIKAVGQKLNRYKNFLNDPGIISELIHSKETLIRKEFPDTSRRYIDSATGRACQFIRLYDTLKASQARYTKTLDSLTGIYQAVKQKAETFGRLLNSKTISAQEIEQLSESYGKDDKNIKQLRQAYSGLKRLSIGRTYPGFSNLTLQNINVNGVNLEYVKGNYFIAAAAGLVDFRIRDFLFTQQKLSRQYVYSARLGYGSQSSDNVILTYFRGRKQLFGGNLQQPVTDIQGVSVSAQFFIDKYVRLYGEVAQSGVPYALGGNNSSKPVIALTDNSQRAYAAGINAAILHTQTTVDGYYQHTGLNYQSFNSFQYNATTNSWSFRLEQFAWKRQLALQVAFRKNDFVNPLVLQRYNANTVFKSFTLSLRKPQWPLLSLGYLPASQYTVVGSQVYENHYQTLMGSISHQYKLGIIRASTLFSFSHFYNDNRDSGLVYYNSTNFFANQTFLFSRFTATVNVSGMNNGRHQLIVLEEGLSATFLKTINAGFAIKVNNLNKNINKVGFNTRVRASIKKLGELNVWMEQSYLPALQQEFYKYEVYNIGFIRYFK
jgi:hypothetical protein